VAEVLIFGALVKNVSKYLRLGGIKLKNQSLSTI